MPVAVVGVIGTVVQSLVLFYQFNGDVSLGMIVKRCQQFRHAVRVLCRQAATEGSRQQQEQRLAHHRLAFKVSDTATPPSVSASESLLNSNSHSQALPKLSSTVMVRLCDSSHSEV